MDVEVNRRAGSRAGAGRVRLLRKPTSLDVTAGWRR